MAEYTTHIRCKVGEAHPMFEKTWCGLLQSEAGNGESGFLFEDIDHAAFHGLAGGRLEVCRNCQKAVVAALVNDT
jgi:hypothetical protein